MRREQQNPYPAHVTHSIIRLSCRLMKIDMLTHIHCNEDSRSTVQSNVTALESEVLFRGLRSQLYGDNLLRNYAQYFNIDPVRKEY
jgi:hypothetical protein